MVKHSRKKIFLFNMKNTPTIRKGFDLFLYQQFERVEPGFSKDDLPDVYEAWKDNLTVERHNKYVYEYVKSLKK